MSVVRTIYTNLAASQVTFATEAGPTVTVSARDLSTLLNTVNAADAPIRLILPYSVGTELTNGHWLTPANRIQVDWSINDLMLWKPGQLGSGIAEVAGDLVRYQGAYAEMIRGMVRMGISTHQVKLIEWRMKPGVFDWPIGSRTYWQGVMVFLKVTEVLDT